MATPLNPGGAATPDTRSEPAASRSPSPTRRGGFGIGWFGLWLDTVTDTPPGVIVGRVSSGGPAASAGIQVDDVLIEVAGQPVTSFSDVADAVVDHVASTPPGTSTIVEVVRNGTRHRLPVVFDREFVLQYAGPTLFAALRQQLGLRLQSSWADQDTLVVDHIERPTEN